MEILIATRNRGKLSEIQTILSDLPVTLRSLDDFPDVPSVDEDGETFEENAIKKALTYARFTNCLTIADDSGIEVDALGGRPGTHSARYSGEHATDESNNRKLLQELDGVPEEKRSARFRCVLAVATPEGKTECVEGTCPGVIGFEPKGSYGFGYDPLFFYSEKGKTFSELTPDEKNTISHRCRALKKLKAILPKYLNR